MDQRLQLVLDYHSGLFTMTELAEQYGISRKTGYKWVDRVVGAEPTIAELTDRSRRPHRSPAMTPRPVVDALIAVRKRHPHWGARKLLAVGAKQHPDLIRPCRSTVCDLLTRAGLVKARRWRARAVGHSPSVLAPITGPNQTWTTDFKGEFRTGDRRYGYPLTLRDGFSRFVLRCDGLLARTLEDTRRGFQRAFAEYGLPDRIRSDNGSPFAGIGLGRLSRLAIWWMRLGIVPERIAPGHPEQNGSHEQFHAVLKAETARPPAAHLRAQQRRFDRFCTEYNEERPHESLADQPPASCYRPSRRARPTRLPPVRYPGHLEVRRVSRGGTISWRAPIFLSERLAGRTSASKKSTTGSGPSSLARSPWRVSTNGMDRFNLWPRSRRGRSPTSRLAPLLEKTNGKNPNRLSPMSPD